MRYGRDGKEGGKEGGREGEVSHLAVAVYIYDQLNQPVNSEAECHHSPLSDLINRVIDEPLEMQPNLKKKMKKKKKRRRRRRRRKRRGLK